MLYEIDHAFQVAARDPVVKVIILAADGPHFSSGHDLKDTSKTLDFNPVVQGAGHHEPGAAGMYAGEEEYFVGLHWRWRNIAKEMLFTGQILSAQECYRLGMVNHVVPNDQLESFTLDLARRIATRPAIGLKLAKQAVNFSMDLQGQQQALTGTLAMHHVGHAHARVQFGMPVDPAGLDVIRNDSKATLKKSSAS
jgi:enoyl-CoA hydratase/carnithine racemase